MIDLKEGFLHIYTGDGKGKTTAATGLSIRAYAQGKRVYIVSFLKTSDSGEVSFIKSLDSENIDVFRFERNHGFIKSGNEINKEEIMRALEFVYEALEKSKCDLLVLDEIICAYHFGCVTKDEILKIINMSGECELVMTGRGAPGWLIDKADYVTEMKCIKHPYDKGIDARCGIEY